MKILHAAETIKGGVATVINSLVEYQTEKAEVNEVLCLIPSDQANNLIKIINLKEIHFSRNGRNIWGMVSFFCVLFSAILREKPDVVHLHSSFAGLLGRLAILLSGRRRKTKVIYCPHAFGFLMATSQFKKNIYSLAEKKLSLLTDKIICVSQSEYNSAIEKGFDGKKLAVIHNGVKTKDKRNLKIQNNKKNYKLLFVGRFDYQKGIDILAQAIDQLGKTTADINYEFTLVGEAVNSDSDIIFHETPHIKINKLGWLKPHQLEKQYLSHDALIIPSRWEGFAMVPLEAMSYGLPIIASDIDAFKEIEDEKFPHMSFFSLNAESLSTRLKQINEIDFEKNSQNSLNVFLNKYSEELMNKKTIQNY